MKPGETLIKFPCEYSIKIVGEATQAFESETLRILRAHVPKLGEGAIVQKLSKENKYLSITAKIWVENKAQLDAIYQDLSACPLMKFVL